ncbi:MAG: hypothetical protein SFZ23_05940 [Planctomycetota bacterium]|nr:hypothetical protein [Planctomycetota bacterium]
MMCVRNRASLCSAAVVSIYAGGAFAAPLAPGGIVSPVPNVNRPAVILYDNNIPFTISVAGFPGVALFQGELRDRVARDTATGKLIFTRAIVNLPPFSLNGRVVRIESYDFSDFTTDVAYDSTSPGSFIPSSVTRSGSPGSLVSFIYNDPGFGMDQPMEWVTNLTDADFFDLNGSTTIRLRTGESITLPTSQPVRDTSPPVCAITAPGPYACACDPVAIIGTAADPQGFSNYRVEYAVNPAGPWTLISSSTTPVVNGTLATWNHAGVPDGLTFIRLTATNSIGQTCTSFTSIRLNKGFDAFNIRQPIASGLYGGNVCLDGTISDDCFANYTIEWRSIPSGTFAPIDPANPVYTSVVVNDPLGTWNTRSPARPDGNYELRFRGTDICGNTRTQLIPIRLDNTAPIARITSPTNCDSVQGVVTIRGEVFDANISGWVLQYTGGDRNNWVTIASGSTNIPANGVLATWDTRSLPNCCYTLRLVASDRANVSCVTSNQTDYYVSVGVGCPADFNGDGTVDFFDYLDFVVALDIGCP